MLGFLEVGKLKKLFYKNDNNMAYAVLIKDNNLILMENGFTKSSRRPVNDKWVAASCSDKWIVAVTAKNTIYIYETKGMASKGFLMPPPGMKAAPTGVCVSGDTATVMYANGRAKYFSKLPSSAGRVI